MKNDEIDLFNKKFDDLTFDLQYEQIIELNKLDNGPLNNVICNIEESCYGARLYNDDYGLTAEMYYVNNKKIINGKIISIDIKDGDYNNLLLQFCEMLSNTYPDTDTIDSFNNFQKLIRGFLEKAGFFTISRQECDKFKNKNPIFFSIKHQNILIIEFINKVQFLRDFFNNNYETKTKINSNYIYLMVNTITSYIKIGTSKNPRFREKTLQSQEPHIHLIAKWECNKEIEKKLHYKFQNKRKRGEWFCLTLSDLKDLENFMENT